MNEIDRRLAEVAATQHQVFSRIQAIEAGLSSSALYRRVRSGLYVVCGRRSLCFAGTTLTFRGRLTAGLVDLGPRALVSGRAAAALLGLDGFEEDALEFLVPRELKDRTTLGRVSSSPLLTALDRVVVDGLACTSGTMTVVQLLGRASEREVGNALDSATRKHLTAPSVVRRRLDELGRQDRRGVAMFERVMESAGVQSWLERRFLALIRSTSLPDPAIQRAYRSDGQHVARVDFDFDPAPVIVGFGRTGQPSRSLASLGSAAAAATSASTIVVAKSGDATSSSCSAGPSTSSAPRTSSRKAATCSTRSDAASATLPEPRRPPTSSEAVGGHREKRDTGRQPPNQAVMTTSTTAS